MKIKELEERYTRLQWYIQQDIQHTFPDSPARILAEQAMADMTLIAESLLTAYEVFGDQPRDPKGNIYGQCRTPDCSQVEYIGGLCVTCYGAAQRQKRKEQMRATRKSAEAR